VPRTEKPRLHHPKPRSAAQKPQAETEIGANTQPRPRSAKNPRKKKPTPGRDRQPSRQAETKIETPSPDQERQHKTRRDGYQLGLMKWLRNGFVEMGFFRERRKWRRDGRIFNRGEGRAGWRKWEKRERKKKGRGKKKKSLKKELVKTFFLFDEECTVTLAFHL
jgi:hypothetical protein